MRLILVQTNFSDPIYCGFWLKAKDRECGFEAVLETAHPEDGFFGHIGTVFFENKRMCYFYEEL